MQSNASDPPAARLVWATDIHLNFLPAAEVHRFCDALAAGDPEAVLIAGDIAEAHDIEAQLERLALRLRRPIYFVLGNHDYYHGSIAEVRARVAALCRRSPHLRYLSEAGVVPLGPGTALVGHDGWGDGRAGDYERSPVRLSDHVLIHELSRLDAAERLRRLNALGDEAAAHFRALLPRAMSRYRHVIVLTHVPPFAAACWHEGRLSDDNWLPHFTCVASGEALVEAALAHPSSRITVLCGHTHGEGVAHLLPNLVVHTGRAEYGSPRVLSLPA